MRRLLRFGRFLDTLHSALPVLSNVSNPLVRFTSAMSRISNTCSMFLDHIACLEKLGLLSIKKSTASRMERASTRFWLYAILLGLIRDIYELLRIYKEEYRTKHKLTKQDSSAQHKEKRGTSMLNESAKMELEVAKSIAEAKQGRLLRMMKWIGRLRLICHFVREHPDVTLDTTKNLCDVFLPLSSLG